jgi:hypothetical protein
MIVLPAFGSVAENVREPVNPAVRSREAPHVVGDSRVGKAGDQFLALVALRRRLYLKRQKLGGDET